MTAAAAGSNAERLRLVLRQAPDVPGTQLCECGKKRFATKEAADRVIARRQALAAGGHAETRAYQEHGWWHLTSQDEPRQ